MSHVPYPIHHKRNIVLCHVLRRPGCFPMAKGCMSRFDHTWLFQSLPIRFLAVLSMLPFLSSGHLVPRSFLNSQGFFNPLPSSRREEGNLICHLEASLNFGRFSAKRLYPDPHSFHLSFTWETRFSFVFSSCHKTHKSHLTENVILFVGKKKNQ